MSRKHRPPTDLRRPEAKRRPELWRRTDGAKTGRPGQVNLAQKARARLAKVQGGRFTLPGKRRRNRTGKTGGHHCAGYPHSGGSSGLYHRTGRDGVPDAFDSPTQATFPKWHLAPIRSHRRRQSGQGGLFPGGTSWGRTRGRHHGALWPWCATIRRSKAVQILSRCHAATYLGEDRHLRDVQKCRAACTSHPKPLDWCETCRKPVCRPTKSRTASTPCAVRPSLRKAGSAAEQSHRRASPHAVRACRWIISSCCPQEGSLTALVNAVGRGGCEP